jgi:hypothetical protein
MGEGISRNEELVHTFPHGKEFLLQALKYLEAEKFKPEYGKNYRLQPGTKAYISFVSFLIEELQNLPFDNQVGKTIKMRSDTEEVIQRLINYIKNKLLEVSKSGKWTKEDLDTIEDIFQEWLEVFKNEIYPKHNIDGVGYSVDLSASISSDDKYVPSGMILGRRFVSNANGFKVVDHGFLNLSFRTGILSMDLDEFPTSNVHLE